MHGFTIGNAWSEGLDFFQRNTVSLLVLIGGATLVGQIILIFAFGFNDAAITAAVTQMQTSPEAGLRAMGGIWLGAMIASYLQSVGTLAALRVGLSSEKDPTSAVTYGLGATVMLILFYMVLGAVVALPAMALFMAIGGLGGSSAGAAVIVALLILVALPLLLWLSARLLLISPIMSANRSYDPFGAAKTSWRLTQPAQWPLVAYILLFFVAIFVAMMIAAMVSSIFMLVGGATVGGLVSGVLSGALSQIASAVMAAGAYRALNPHNPGDVFA